MKNLFTVKSITNFKPSIQ